MFSRVKGASIERRRAMSHNRRMQLEGKDWVVGIVIAALLAAVTMFQDNTYVSNSILALLGFIVSYIVFTDKIL